MAKDYFSGHSKLYATFRPTYPEALYEFIFKHVRQFDKAWDCATGNGQVAHVLAKHFKQVYATDISSEQIKHAHQEKNIVYKVEPAEQTSFANNQFDLITVAQAMHWLQPEDFFREVTRVVKPGAILAVWGYANCFVNSEIDKHFVHFYQHIVGPYWDKARVLIEQHYQPISFPFEEIPSPPFQIQVNWNLEQFAGYITTWSATQKYICTTANDPVPEFMERIKPYWKNEMPVTFPIFLRLMRVK
ncbi:MAG: class I SAM-dependent methyltransferase [Cyclobacteriaceae bacterium]|nr:MAG: class I SAM-dependent methyltransferase [Cyclobacteriaceae bacterium]